MKSAFVTLSLLISTQSSFANEIICTHGEQCVDVLRYRHDGCRQDMIDGKGNYCFKGNVADIAAFINDGGLDGSTTSGLVLNSAEVIDENTIKYVGHKKQYLMTNRNQISRCQ